MVHARFLVELLL